MIGLEFACLGIAMKSASMNALDGNEIIV